jgi:saccharopine dehydrogenase-like NADP-dependent oxidoreductase
MKRVAVLGGGMVGGVMAENLAKESGISVTVVDRNPEVLSTLKEGSPVNVMLADLSDHRKVKEVVEDCDLVVGAVPGSLGFQTLKAVIEAGKNYADISFMPEDYFELDQSAKERGVTAVVDCGVAPGLSNMIVGRLSAELDRMEEATILVGGLPKAHSWPYEYKAPFSPIDVIEEYTRPARYVRNGRIVTVPALSEPELVNIPDVGVLEAFNTDGLRSLLRTINCPNMKEKTLRYPGHAEKMRMLRETGFFGTEPIEIAGMKVRPIDVTSQLLFPMWRLEQGEEEFTVMQIQVVGVEDGRRVKYTCDLLDRTNGEAGTSSMARTTGFSCVTIARMLLKGEYAETGIIPPEIIGRDKAIFEKVVAQLRELGVVLKYKMDIIRSN